VQRFTKVSSLKFWTLRPGDVEELRKHGEVLFEEKPLTAAMSPLEAELRSELPQAVLRAIARGARTPEQIAKASTRRVDDIKRSIKRLVFVGAIKPVATGARDGYELTKTGASVIAATILRAVAQFLARSNPACD